MEMKAKGTVIRVAVFYSCYSLCYILLEAENLLT